MAQRAEGRHGSGGHVMKPVILFLIPSLGTGGAERQLCELVHSMDTARFAVHVVTFYDPGVTNGGELWPDIAGLPGVSLVSLHKRRGLLGYPAALLRLAALFRRLRPVLIHGYTGGNEPALLLGRIHGARVVWGIRRSTPNINALDRASRIALSVTLRFARFTDLVIFNSQVGLRNYQAMGLRSKRMVVIQNGIDTAKFSPNSARGLSQRQAWGVPAGVPLVGIVGRLNPVKDHPTFLRLAALVAAQRPDARFVCIGGRGEEAYRERLGAIATELGIAERIYWPGICVNMPDAYRALTVSVLCSTEEGFPNVLCEAMACGVPCVTTPVGDAVHIIGDTGLVAPVGDTKALAAQVLSILSEPQEAYRERAQAARQRIVDCFNLEMLVRNTERELMAVLQGDGK